MAFGHLQGGGRWPSAASMEHYKTTEPGPGPARDFTFTGVRRSAPECPGVDFHPELIRSRAGVGLLTPAQLRSVRNSG